MEKIKHKSSVSLMHILALLRQESVRVAHRDLAIFGHSAPKLSDCEDVSRSQSPLRSPADVLLDFSLGSGQNVFSLMLD